MKNRRAWNRFGANKHATSNSMGFRGTAEYSAAIPEGRYRIIFLGNSFTYGVDAGDENTFVAQIPSLDPSIETVNMGVAGYGIDQMYLFYQRYQVQYATNLVVLTFIEDDLRRMKLSAFMTTNPKPRLLLNGNAIVTTNVPVPTWGVSTQTGWLREFPNRTALVQVLRTLYDVFVQDYDSVPVAEQVFVKLNELSLQKHQRFAVVYLPARNDLANDQRSETARKLEEFAAHNDILFVDLTGSMRAAQKEESAPLFVTNGAHYSELGYKTAAALLFTALRKAVPDFPKPADSLPRRRLVGVFR